MYLNIGKKKKNNNKLTVNKRQRKPKGRSRMDKLATLGTKDTGRTQTKQKPQHRKLK